MFRILRGIAALVVLIAALAAIPLALVHFVGNPLPTKWAGWSVVWSAIQRGDVANDTVMKVLALFVWIAWGRIAVSVIVELGAALAHRPAPQVVGLGASQQWAASFVSSVLLIAGSFGHAGAAGTSQPSLRAVVAEFSVASPESGGTVMVERGDSLSSIAQEQLGSAQKWPTLWEVNRGRQFDQRTFTDPNLILPGWELIVPAQDQPVADTFPTAEESLPVQAEVVSAVTLPPATVAPATVAPATVAPATVAPATVAPATVPPAEAIAPAPTAPRPDHEIDAQPIDAQPIDAQLIDVADTADDASVPGGLGAAVLVSCGVLGAVTARRRQQLRRARVGSRLLEPTRIATSTETMLRSLDAAERVTRLDIAIRAAAADLSLRFAEIAILGAIVDQAGSIELLLTGPVTSCPASWRLGAPDRWVLDGDTDLSELAQAARRVNQPCPALAHVGSTTGGSLEIDPSTPADLFLDLEALGLLAIDAPIPHAADIVRAIAAGVMVSPLAEIAHVITCGLADAHLGHQSAQSAESLDAALDLAASALGTTAAATSAGVTTFSLRSRQLGGEAWEPAILLADTDVFDDHLDADLVSLTQAPGRGLAVVISRPIVGANWTIRHHGDHWTLLPLGLSIVPVGLSSCDLHSVHALVDEAAQPLLSPVTSIHRHADIASQADIKPAFTEQNWSLMVRIIGQIEVVDREHAAVKFERSKALELVAWLSQHRDHATRTGARTALWELNVRDATFANVVSDARRSMSHLVEPPEGVDWLGRTLTEQLPLHDGVVTDAGVLALRMAHAQDQQPNDAIQTLRPGLELVRDMPFAGANYLWPDAEGITSRLILLVTSAATMLAKHYLTLEDTDGVFWATDRGLKVLAGHEELIALRMRAHARSGNLAGVRAEWESYERALTMDAWSDGEPSPKLVKLRRELLSPSLLRV